MLKFSPTQKISAANDLILEDMAGETMILNIEGNQFYSLDEVGTRMWQALTNLESIGAALDLLLNEYNVEPDLLQRDLENLLENLVKHELIELSGS